MKQRVHGVVDLYSAHKPSWQALREEASPVDSLQVAHQSGRLAVTVRARSALPAYTLRDYTVRAVIYDATAIPVERVAAALPDLPPGHDATVQLAFTTQSPARIEVDVLRPSGISTLTTEWRPQ